MTATECICLHIPDGICPTDVVGSADRQLRHIQDVLDASIVFQNDAFLIEGSHADVQRAVSLLDDVFKRVETGELIDNATIDRAVQLMQTDAMSPEQLREDVILTHRGHAIRPKTAGQKRYLDAIRENTIVFGLGPAGTGKTYLAMAMALRALRHKEVGRIILSRPIVEAGESLGFLPGTLTEKVDPYLRPLYDALFDMTDTNEAAALIDEGTIEIAPLAFMRGRTLNDSFIILDEAQNATPEQMKMFLTRLGYASKMVVTGDETQTDLVGGAAGLRQARDVLTDCNDIAFCEFSGKDVVRNSLVASIVAAYERYAKES